MGSGKKVFEDCGERGWARVSPGAAIVRGRCRWPCAFHRRTFPTRNTLASGSVSGNFRADFALYLDQLSLVMLLVVTGVGFLIHIYSVGLHVDDPSYYRFFTYLNLFMVFLC